MENKAAIELEKNAIALNLQQQITNTLLADLAEARVRIRELEAIVNAKTVAPATT